jgi:hypothetical protein
MIPNTFTQRGVPGGDPLSGFGEGCDMVVSPYMSLKYGVHNTTATHTKLVVLRACLCRQSQTPTICTMKTKITMRPSKNVEMDVIRISAP